VTDQLGIVVLKLVELSSGTVAKQLLLGLDLLVHFQSRHEAYAIIVFLCGFLALDVAGLLLGQLVVGAWVKVGAHIILFVVFQMMRPFDRLRGLFLQKESAKIENIWIG
jgi:cytochrome bd-type quinol oxidase subunit 2